MTDSNEHDFGLICSFWIDTDAYTDRDRELFTAGYEFADLLRHLRYDPEMLNTTIHRENESRVRMACAQFGRLCSIKPCEAKYDPQGVWSYLVIAPRSGK